MRNTLIRDARVAATRARQAEGRARWRGPIEGPRHRAAAWASMLFADHGLLRPVWRNVHRVGEGAWRSAQPTPGMIRWFARTHGQGTVVNLRGGETFGSLPLEIEACRMTGLDYRTLTLKSRELPAAERVREAAALFATATRPILFHCKSGADRAGLVSALWLLIEEGASAETAARQLSWRFGHVSTARAGVLDAMIEAYGRAEAESGIGFLDWVRRDYDPAAIAADHRPTTLGTLLSDRLLGRE